MALPSTITGSWSDHLNEMHGPFLVSGALYVFTLDKTNNTVRAYKSTDQGNTWTEQDSAHVVSGLSALTTTAGQKSMSCVQSGTTIYIGYVTTNNHVRVVTFASDLWGTASASESSNTATNVSGNTPIFASVRSNGDVVVFFGSAAENVMGTNRRRFSYNILSGGVWGTAVQFGTGVADHYDLRYALLGASDRIHFFYTKAAGGHFHRSLSSTNVLDTESASLSSGGATGNYAAGLGFYQSDQQKVFMPILDSDGASLLVLYFTSQANPTFPSFGSASASEGTASNPFATAGLNVGTATYFLTVKSADRDVYIANEGKTASTLSTFAVQEASVTAAGINCNYISAPAVIGIVFNDNGTVKYDQFEINSVPPFARDYRLKRNSLLRR